MLEEMMEKKLNLWYANSTAIRDIFELDFESANSLHPVLETKELYEKVHQFIILNPSVLEKFECAYN